MVKKQYRRIGVTLIVLIAFLMMSVLSFAQELPLPLLKAGTAYMDLQRAKTLDEELTINLRYSAGNNADQDSKILEQVLKYSYIKCRVLEDASKKEASMTMTLYIDNKPALSGKVYATMQYVILNFPDLYQKPVYVAIYQSSTINGTPIDINKYVSFYDFQNDKDLQKLLQDYSKVLLPKLIPNIKLSDKKVELTFSNGKKESCDEVVFKLDKKTAVDLLKVILDKASKDSQTKQYIVKIMKKFIEYAQQTGDLSKFANGQVSQEDINSALDELDKNYESSLGKAVSQLEQSNSKIPPFTFQYSMMIDNNNSIKGERLYFYLKDSNNLKVMIDMKGVINSINQPVKIEKIDKSKAVDSQELTDKDLQDIQQKATNILVPFIAPLLKL